MSKQKESPATKPPKAKTAPTDKPAKTPKPKEPKPPKPVEQRVNRFPDRIIRSEHVDPRKVVPNVDNWRKHPEYQRTVMEDVLETLGWIQDIIVNVDTGNLIDGHMRLELALRNKEATVPVKYVSLSPEEERRALSTFDSIGAMAEADHIKLRRLTESMKNAVVDTSTALAEQTAVGEAMVDMLHNQALILQGGNNETDSVFNPDTLNELDEIIDPVEVERQQTRADEIPRCPHCERPLPPSHPALRKPYIPATSGRRTQLTPEVSPKPSETPAKTSDKSDTTSSNAPTPSDVSTPARSTRKPTSSRRKS